MTEDTGHTVLVEPFLSSLSRAKNVKIATCAIAYDCPTTFNTFILFFPQFLYFEGLKRHLLCPNQMRSNQVVVNETPLIHIPFDARRHADHSIITTPPVPELQIPLLLDGTKSYFPSRKPTREEIDSEDNCIHVRMTADKVWEPHEYSTHNDEAALRSP